MAIIDSSTLSVLTTLAINMIGATLIFLGFICVRTLRGDKKLVRGSTIISGDQTNRLHDVHFEESVDFN